MIGNRPNCFECVHLDYLAAIMKCSAFPNGIPADILQGRLQLAHIKGQVGEFVYEKLEKRNK